MTVECIMCTLKKGKQKQWKEFDAKKVRVHFLDDHQAILFFISDEEVKQMVQEVKEEDETT